MTSQHTSSREHGGAWVWALFMGIAGAAMLLFPWLVLASDRQDAMTETAAHASMSPQIVMVADNTEANQEDSTISTRYNSSMTYAGIFDPSRLYRRNPDYGYWTGSADPSHLKQVMCPQARVSLTKTGEWKGQLTHGGSCGSTAEPADWALGNLLNYQGSLNEKPADTQ
jgi:hypothetical protein